MVMAQEAMITLIGLLLNNGLEVMEMNVGNRIIYDQDGDIVVQLGEMVGDVPARKEITSLSHIDIPFGEIDLNKKRIVGINVTTKTPILEDIVTELTEEQKRIQELENQILLMSGVI